MNIAVSIFLFSVLIIQAQSRVVVSSEEEEDVPKESKVALNDVMSVILPAFGQNMNKAGMQ
jgi:hypothetical protein